MFGTKYLSSYGTYEFQAYFLHSSFDTICNEKNWNPTMPPFSWSIFLRAVIGHMICYNFNWPKIKL